MPLASIVVLFDAAAGVAGASAASPLSLVAPCGALALPTVFADMGESGLSLAIEGAKLGSLEMLMAWDLGPAAVSATMTILWILKASSYEVQGADLWPDASNNMLCS
jgi:hypothetical protein